MTQQQYINLQKRIMKRVEKSFYPKVYSALQAEIISISNTLKDTGIAQALTRLDLLFMNGLMVKALKDLYVNAALPIAKKHYAILKPIIDKAEKKEGKSFTPRIETKGFGFNDQWTAEIITFFNQYLLDKIVMPITETTKEMIRQILEKGIAEGWSVDRIVKELEDSELTKVRAARIVRTEAVRATNYASMLAASEFDYEMEKTWLEIRDNRTRRSHRHGTGVGGQTVDFLEQYSNGLLFPGDPNGPGKETINCRCTQKITPKRDDNGRLIPIHHKLPLNVALGLAA